MTLLRDVEVGGLRCDIRLSNGHVTEIAGSLTTDPGEEILRGDGGALIPGLHDHHLHLLAMAAAKHSLDLKEVVTRDGLRGALARHPGVRVRAVGYTDTHLGPLDRDALDELETRPLRVQHSGGSLWVLNSAAIQELAIEDEARAGLERDATGRLTGRVWRLDAWLASRLDLAELPDLSEVGAVLAAHGITGVTDATPDLDASVVAHLSASRESGALPQRLHLLNDSKIILSDHALPSFDELCQRISALHDNGKPAALHCVTREAVALLIAALDTVGTLHGDRVEHAALVDDSAAQQLARLGVSVVTQPGFMAARGERYLRELPADDHCDLYRFSGLLAHGITTVASSDSPFGPLDPWAMMAAASTREAEAVSSGEVLDGLLRPLADLHAPARTIAVGCPADLVLLHSPLAQVLRTPSADLVRQTWCDGAPIL